MVAAAGGRWAALYNDAKEYFADGGIQLDKYLILKVSSVVAGALMILAGMIGSSALFLGGGFAYFIGSLYAIAFGVLVQVIEIKNKYGDPPERIKPLYKLLDFYLKFLTLQRGKGLFYMGVGLLCFYIAPEARESSWFGSWGAMNVSAIALAAVGCVHTFKVVVEKQAPAVNGGEAGMRPAGDELDFSSPMDFSSSTYPARKP
mmetsp:Transcript_13680/g.32691  ORF Transcript_13680/g.32691 Transcript_13680/m.32691 type:complete len:203 (+) Transcript_13680:44-652(+)